MLTTKLIFTTVGKECKNEKKNKCFNCDAWMHIEKESLKRLGGGGRATTYAYYLHFDANTLK